LSWLFRIAQTMTFPRTYGFIQPSIRVLDGEDVTIENLSRRSYRKASISISEGSFPQVSEQQSFEQNSWRIWLNLYPVTQKTGYVYAAFQKRIQLVFIMTTLN
jgi:hypothetical protein